MENRGLNYALIEGYHTSLMKGRYPVCCLFLEMNPAAVDVNIHPSKREVKFHREFEIRKFTMQAVRDALLAFHSEPAKANPATQPSRHTGSTGGTIGNDFAGPKRPGLRRTTPEFPHRPCLNFLRR